MLNRGPARDQSRDDPGYNPAKAGLVTRQVQQTGACPTLSSRIHFRWSSTLSVLIGEVLWVPAAGQRTPGVPGVRPPGIKPLGGDCSTGTAEMSRVRRARSGCQERRRRREHIFAAEKWRWTVVGIASKLLTGRTSEFGNPQGPAAGPSPISRRRSALCRPVRVPATSC